MPDYVDESGISGVRRVSVRSKSDTAGAGGQEESPVSLSSDYPAEGRGARWRQHLPHVVGFLLMIAAIAVVQNELRHLSMADIRAAMHRIPSSALFMATGCTFLSYFILSFYDRLAVIQVGYSKIHFRRTAFAAFCSYVLSHNLGFSAVSGAAVRFRLYRNWGLPPVAIAQIIAFCSITYLLGAAALIGSVLLLEPSVIPVLGQRLPSWLLNGIGVLLWGAVGGYALIGLKCRQMTLRGHQIDFPSPLMAIAQTVVSAADVAATAAIAWVLLPAGCGLDYAPFLAIYIASYTAGLVASVPGGLGVFDGTMLLALTPWLPASQILGVIFVFRLFYYIVPLFLAGGMFAGHELFLRGDAAIRRGRAGRDGDIPEKRRPSAVVRESEADFSVTVSTGTVALCGAMLLTLPVTNPLVAVGANGMFLSDYTLSLIGAVLIALALGLAQRVTLAWSFTLFLLSIAAVLTFLRGNMVIVPLMLGFSAFLVAPFRKCYYRHARLLSEPLSLPTIGALLFLLCCVMVLATHRMPGAWWEMLSYQGLEGRRWIAGLAILLGFLVIVRLVRAGRVTVSSWSGEKRDWYLELDHAVQNFPACAPEGLITGEAGQAAIPVRRRGHLLVGMGDPAGNQADAASVIWRLRDLAVQEGRQPVFWCVGNDFLKLYGDLGLVNWPLEDSSDRYLCCAPEQSGLVRSMLAVRRGGCARN
ncbi:MAG: lysylphosphatidylglycerol synthase domain-containing protein [Acetobacter sp.]|jgi:uncharacterized membrane protein YbhN (UPF0104 family)